MTLTILDSMATPEMAAALEEFEAQFRYPLGSESWFRISHGDDYTRFFRAIGETRCFVATEGATVTGVISAMICQVRQPHGQLQRGAYISDLKVRPPARGPTLLQLLRAATDWVLTQPTPGFCVVMDGTARNPMAYTGRLGIPPFRELAKVMILRISCDTVAPASPRVKTQTIDAVKDRFRQLTADCHATDGGIDQLRSQMTPIGFMHVNGNACGILEDTRRAKLLFRDDGNEMVSAHLSSFGYRSAEDAVELVAAAADRCRSLDVPALFLAVPASDADAIVERLPQVGVIKAPATVFGYAFEEPGEWAINTSEI